MNVRKLRVAACALTAAGCTAASAHAQSPPDPSARKAPPPALAASPGPPPQPAVDPRPDHDQVVGKYGVSWLGVSEIPIAEATPTGTASQPGVAPSDRVNTRTVSAPALGVRYWLNRFIGVEPGIGFSYTGGRTRSELGTSEASVDKQSTTAVLFHVGAPMALARGKHLALTVIPELNLGLARSTVASLMKDNAPPDAKLSGLRIDAGARVGAEIHFGFMGLPELSLEGSVGLLYSRQSASAEVGSQRVTDVNTQVTTTTFNNPWDIFRSVGAVAARYYF